MKPPLKSAAQSPNYYSISKNEDRNEGRKELVLTRQVTNPGTRRHDWENTDCYLGGGSIFMYIIQGDMLDFSKLSTAWVFLKREREGKETREREKVVWGWGSYMGFGSSFKAENQRKRRSGVSVWKQRMSAASVLLLGLEWGWSECTRSSFQADPHPSF